MAWLSQNWILVLAGIVLVVLVMRRSNRFKTRNEGEIAPADGNEAGHDRHKGKHQHGGHGCC